LSGPTYRQRHMGIRFAEDSALEGTGFEPSVPRREKWSMPSSSDQTRVGRTLTLGGGAESSLEGRDTNSRSRRRTSVLRPMISTRTARIDDNLGRGTDSSNPLPSSGEMLWGGRRGWQLRCLRLPTILNQARNQQRSRNRQLIPRPDPMEQAKRIMKRLAETPHKPHQPLGKRLSKDASPERAARIEGPRSQGENSELTDFLSDWLGNN
jgi:hypothetical protein